jgi:hypothetical protein
MYIFRFLFRLETQQSASLCCVAPFAIAVYAERTADDVT